MENHKDKKTKKKLINEYKQLKTYMGVYKITNIVNNKIYISSTLNLKNNWLTICEFKFKMGNFFIPQMQRDWNELGADAFTYEVLEEKEVKDDLDNKWELKKMENIWLEKLQPYEDKGYN